MGKLEQLGFVFNMEAAAFEEGLQQLRLFKSVHGHCDVPTTFVTAAGYKLGAWCSNQRTRLKSRPDDPRAQQLLEVGFKLDPQKETWDRHCKLAAEYVALHGALPSTYTAPTGEKLGAWLYRQLRKLKEGGLSEDQAKRLAEAGLG